MAIQVEIKLKIPNTTLRSDENVVSRIDHTSVRFAKRITVPAVPRSGDAVSLTTSTGYAFEGNVTRVEWSDEQELFVVDCRHAKRSLSAFEYNALISDTDWTKTPLLRG
jgi:hypothetical protein